MPFGYRPLVAGTAGEWERRARPDKWLTPGERILWRGAPDPSVIFSAQDLYLIPFSVLWLGFAIFWEHGVAKEGWSFGVIWGVPFICAGVYIVIGRFPVKVWTRLHTSYAVTDLRAVEVTKAGDLVRSAYRHVPVEIRRRRDGRHGMVIFDEDVGGGLGWRQGSQWSFLRGTGWPGAGRLPELAFVDVDRIDELVSIHPALVRIRA